GALARCVSCDGAGGPVSVEGFEDAVRAAGAGIYRYRGVTMAKGGWAAFPHKDNAYVYAGPALKKNWDRLHRGDCEPFPKDEAAQEAWRLFHAGEFESAVSAGLAAGSSGINAANK